MTDSYTISLFCVLVVLSGFLLVPALARMALSEPWATATGIPFILLGLAGFIGILLRPIILNATMEADGK